MPSEGLGFLYAPARFMKEDEIGLGKVSKPEVIEQRISHFGNEDSGSRLEKAAKAPRK